MNRFFKILTGNNSGGRGTTAHRPPAVIWIPAVLAAVGVLIPILYLVLRAMGAEGDVWALLFRARTLTILGRTILLIVSVTLTSMVISLPIAWLTTRTNLPFRRLWSMLTVLPLVIPSYVVGLVVIATLGPKGMMQQALNGLFGLERLPSIYGFPGALLTITLVTFPYMLLALRTSIQGLDPRIEEASRSLGHNKWATFRRITLPHLRPAIAAGALLVALYTLRDFGAVSLMRYETFTWAIYVQYQSSFDRMMAAALSIVLVIIAIVILIIEVRTRSKAKYHRVGAGATHKPAPTRLGKWHWPALGFCTFIVFISLITPVSVLIYWAVRGISAGEPFNLTWSYALNSGYVSLLAALAAVAAAMPISILSVRFPGRLGGLLERTTYIGFALPGIVIALALVFFGANYAPFLYQTIGILIFAYVILFLPQAVGTIRSSLLQISPRIEEASRSLGRSPFQTMLRVTLPLVWPGILAAMALVFLTTMKELPATMLLGPSGFKTLATSIWSATSEAFFARAAVPALFLILVSSIPLSFFVIRKRGN